MRIALLLFTLAGAAQAATITKPHTFSSGQTIASSRFNDNFDTIYSEFNGNISTANILNSTILTEDIAASAITGALILDRTVLANDIGQGIITGGDGGHLASGTVTGANIATSNITRDHIPSEEILSVAIRNFTIVGGNGGDIASATITGANIATNNVSEDHLTTGSVDSVKLLDGGILVGDVRPGTLTGGNGGTLGSGTITGGNLATNNVSEDHLTTGSVNSTKLLDGGILVGDIRPGTLTGGSGGTLASATVYGGNIVTGNVTEDILGASAVTFPKLNPLVEALGYQYRNLVVDVGSTTTNVTVNADWVTLENPDDSTLIVVRTIALTCTPVSGAAALNAQTTAFAAAARPYFLWIAAKADGTAEVAGLSSSSVIATVQNEFVAIDGTYTYCGLYGAVVNNAAGSYTLYEQHQIGGSVAYLQRVLFINQTSTSAGMLSSMGAAIPADIADRVNVTMYTSSNAVNATAITVFAGDSGNTFYSHSNIFGDFNIFIPDYPATDGMFRWSLDLNGGPGTGQGYVQGYTINHLSR